MIRIHLPMKIGLPLLLVVGFVLYADAQTPPPVPIPPALEEWKAWATWKDRLAGSPRHFNNAEVREPVWPGELTLTADAGGGKFGFSVTVYAAAWVPLPGDADTWPQRVMAGTSPASVVERDGRPALRLDAGTSQISGEFPWKEMPQRLAIPMEIGVIRLSMDGVPVEVPNWDESGLLWLKRTRVEEETEREFLSAQVYRVIEDGIPMWLRTEIELSVSGKSREEDLGNVLPKGWKVASVDSPLPCAVDDAGRVKAQVRAGKWTIRLDAFRSAADTGIAYAEGVTPMVAEELIGFQAKPDFRVIELLDIAAIDVSQTTFPEKWRNLPVYRWDTAKPFRIEEKMRGMGFQRPAGLAVTREFWLDDGGALMTFRDQVKGTSQQVWRLDVSPGQTLGAARMAGEGQLITRNPASQASGIEVRQREIQLDAVGRIDDSRRFPASGWQADVDRCDATLHLPPGWRVLALFGAEWVNGDWLTSWTLLDLFLLLVFAMSVGRLWGFFPAVVAFLGFGLTYHEPDAPRWLWFFLLVPLAILRVLPPSRARTAVEIWKVLAVAALMVGLVPFVGRQVQGVLYPQLEPVREQGFAALGGRGQVNDFANEEAAMPQAEALPNVMQSMDVLSSRVDEKVQRKASKLTSNLLYDSKAQIQTGPAIPNWSWREVRFGWRGPVTAAETVQVILIPPLIQRGITLLRVMLLILLVAVLLDVKRLLPPFLRRKVKLPPPIPAAAALVIGLLAFPLPEARAQAFPSDTLLEELRARLSEVPDAFPHAAEIATVTLTAGQKTIAMDLEVHVAAECAVPLPGRLPAWSPVTVQSQGKSIAVLRRDDYLWVALSPGTHQIHVEGVLPGSTEWEWTFLLKPRQVTIQAPGWAVTGVKATGVPEDQVFFAIKSPAAETEVAYDRKDFAPVVQVDRAIELGLIWQVRTTLKRLSPVGKAIALSVPLLPGERVLSSHFTVASGLVEARLGAGETEVSWESELAQEASFSLKANESGRWVESWRLVASPVWNVAFQGLSPVYEAGAQGLEPVWRPWPGENVDLTLTRPEAIPGATMTVRGVQHSTSFGSRQRTSSVRLNLQASLGQDFVVELDPAADVTALRIQDAPQPVRRDGARVVIPVRPGEQTIDLEWKMLQPMAMRAAVDPVKLPVESSNISTTLAVPEDRWVLWADGPLRGPAVRLWVVAVLAVIGAFVLGRLKSTPLGGSEWALLALGLTQVNAVAALLLVGWFFLLAWRGSDRGIALRPFAFNVLQWGIIVGVIPVVVTLLVILHRGLLGTPEMMVQGNGSTPTDLRWFAQRADSDLPAAEVITVSVWYYRLLMLFWALWLAAAALRWVRWGWTAFSRETVFKRIEWDKRVV